MSKEAEVIADLGLGHDDRPTRLLHACKHRGQVISAIEVHERADPGGLAVLAVHDRATHGVRIGC